MLNIGTRVVVTGIESDKSGTVVGFANYQSPHTGRIEPGYIVRLDKGVRSEDGAIYFDLIVVHYGNAQEESEHG